MALEGTIKDFGLPDIFQLIGLQRKTGTLTLKNEREKVTVLFDGGMVVGADSSAKRLEDRIGHVMVKQGKITDEKLEECLQTQKQTLQRLGHVLVSSGAITEQDLKEAIQLQTSQNVFRLFRWKEGDYHFAPSDSVDYDKSHVNPMSADFILMEGIRMVDEWPIIEKKITSMDLVIRSVVDASMIEVGGGDDDAADDPLAGLGGDGDDKPSSAASSRIRLSGEEERVFRKVDGRLSVQQIVDACGLGEFDTCRVLFDLLNRNIVAIAGRGGAAQAVAGRAEGPASPLLGYALLGVAVLGGAAGLALHPRAPFGVLGQQAYLGGAYELLQADVSMGRFERIDRAVAAYALARGEVPGSLDAVVEAGLLGRADLRDARSRPFEYEARPSGYRLSGAPDAGPAGARAVERDISLPPR